MKDSLGLYYYPKPDEVQTRVYVREGEYGVEFRLWRAERPDVWEKHGWLPHSVIEAAAVMYKERSPEADPMRFYDINVAKALLKEG